ncbi:MAG: TIGR00730 family Rossman fold protein [Bacteroidaceae bacterium]|nr:TIGR00730 family Rossman fold protein [Bacteroidaceae bacterium]MBR7134908.1 TIGR00730 family Rossman fold protein [Bacteroidaceae bacterium]
MTKPKSICVYCASSSRVDECYTHAAHLLGKLIAQKNMQLITGGGVQGLMRAVEDGALEANGIVTGVIPRFMMEQGWNHPALTNMHVTPDMHTRKKLMAELSDAVIALPGGCGTMEELCEIITWKQLGLYLKPIVILNINEYYNPLIAQFEKAIDQHFMGQIHGKIWSVAHTPQEAMEIIEQTPEWSPEIRKYAAL